MYGNVMDKKYTCHEIPKKKIFWKKLLRILIFKKIVKNKLIYLNKRVYHKNESKI